MSKTPEASVRDPSIKLAKKAGVLHKRMHFGHGTANGWPDDLFVFPGGHYWWVEFKRPGGEATPLQNERHMQIRAFDGDVSVIDDKQLFRDELGLRLARCVRERGGGQ